ncbi:MAG TPA: hypothetical protein VK811_07870 [Candidatus Acidoferrum sp.]|nr:hypothetical protein [Candidatus Acidoferrum sp.]
MKQLFAVCGVVAALFCGVSSVSAQNNGGNGGGGGGWNGGRGGNFDPAQFQQRMMDGIRDQLGFTNDTDWDAVQPLVQKVTDARLDLGIGNGMRMMFNRNRNRDQNGGDNNRPRFGNFGRPPSPEAQALQNAIDNNAPDGQIKDLLTRYQASQKAKQDKLKAAQDNLRAVLTVKQEATATLLGLLE